MILLTLRRRFFLIGPGSARATRALPGPVACVTSVILFKVLKITSAVIVGAMILSLPSQAQTNIFPTAGYVGIGTTTPNELFQIRNGFAFHDGTNKAISFSSYWRQNAWRPLSTGYVSVLLWDPTLGRLLFQSTSTAYDPEATTTVETRFIILSNGNVGIGTTSPTHKLTVNGQIRAKEVIVDTGWADYVFADDYQLPPLSEVEAHIREHKHLPGIPSSATVESEGVSLGEMQAALLAKIEELTLHLIAQDKKLAEQSEILKSQASRLDRLETENAQLKQSTRSSK
jgi:hypothetical protein